MQNNQTPNRWKTFGQRKTTTPLSMIQASQSGVKQQKKYRPSKDRQLSGSKVFNRSRSKYDSMIMKEQNSSNYERDMLSSRSKNFHENSKHQYPQIHINELGSKQNLNGGQKISSFPNQKNEFIKPTKQSYGQLKQLKEDYNKFKQKIVTQLQLQKQNIIKIINNILANVKKELQGIQKKYASISNYVAEQKTNNLKVGQSLDRLKNNLNLQTEGMNQIHNKVKTIKTSNTDIIINKKNTNQLQNISLVLKFQTFFTALQGLKKDMNSLHQISSLQHITSPINSYHGSPLNSPKSDTFRQGLLGFWK